MELDILHSELAMIEGRDGNAQPGPLRPVNRGPLQTGSSHGWQAEPGGAAVKGVLGASNGGSSILDVLGKRTQVTGFAGNENQQPSSLGAVKATGAAPDGKVRSSLGSFSSDLLKLRAEFETLQQQLHQLPSGTGRRDSLGGKTHAPVQGVTGPAASTSGQGTQPLGPEDAAQLQSAVTTASGRQVDDAVAVPSAPSSAAVHQQQPLPVAITAPPAAPPQAAPVPQVNRTHVPPAAISQRPAASFPAAPSVPAPAPSAAPASSSLLLSNPPTVAAATLGGLASDCPLTGGAGRTGEGLFQFPGSAPAGSRTWKAASEMFEDPELVTLCEEVLNKQLQRTRDGATDQSRIHELAVLVKHLRKCVRELGSRVSMYVDECLRLEKEHIKQLETVQLASETAVKAMEAELAGAKRSLAGAEASAKADKAGWGAELEGLRFEVGRLRRELERVTEERDKSREEAARADQGRQHLEVELKELRKASSQQIREVAASSSEAVRSINEERAAAERREAGLREESARLSQRLDAATTFIEALQGELSLLQQVHESTKDSLKVKTASEEALTRAVSQLQSELSTTQAQLAAVTSDLAATQSRLAEAAALNEKLSGEAATATQALEAMRSELQSVRAQAQAEKEALEQERATLQADLASATEREAALGEEKGALKGALAAALGHNESLEMALGQANRENAALGNESVHLRHQIDFITGQQQAAEEKADSLTEDLAAVNTRLTQAQQELEGKEEKLALMEGEFAALKEVLGDAGGRADVVTGLLSKISALQAAAAASEATRRKLHNELVTIKGNIRVYCRVRPHPASVLRLGSDQTSVAVSVEGKEHQFNFDRVYSAGSSQEEVFSGVSELVQSALDGFHVCLFSYGQTGAGKTYTMQGGDGPDSRGIIPRAVEKILETAGRLHEQCEWEYNMEASFVEVYNNSLRDLLGGSGAQPINDQSAIKHDPAGGHTTVVGVNKVPVTDMSSAEALVRRAASARACDATAMNAESSRSHSVFMLYITGAHPPTGTRLQGCLCLVDLAGSERLNRSQAEDARKKEACAINQSLSALGDVFAALSSRSGHVPYRNSKLTYLLQPCLGGQGKTLMFVNVTPEPASAYETLCSLRFAAKVNGCETAAKGGARRNVTTGGTALPSQMAAATGAGGSGGSDGLPDGKRFSLPGPARVGSSGAAGQDPAAKRMSMYTGNGAAAGAGAPSAGSKRPLGVPPSGAAAGNAAKRPKQ